MSDKMTQLYQERYLSLFLMAVFVLVLLVLCGCTDKLGSKNVWQHNSKLARYAEEGNEDAVVRLMNDGMSVNAINSRGATALMGASLNNRAEMATLLLENGADVNSGQEMIGHTTIMLAAKNASVELVRLLIEAGADVNAANAYGHTALMLAVNRGRTDVAGALIDAGADVNAVDGFGWPVLLHAAQRGHVETVKFLLARGAKPLG